MTDLTKKIIHVDDDTSVRELIGAILDSCIPDLELVQAEDAETYLALEDKRADLYILDGEFPGGGWRTVAKHINENYPEKPIVLLSGTVDNYDLTNKPFGVVEGIGKPFNMASFVSRVEHYLGME